jgi:hypothetical protein
MDDSSVESAMIAKAKTVVGITFVTANVPNPKPSGIWARITYGPGEVQADGLGVQARERLFGVLMVDVFGPKGDGRAACTAAAVNVMQNFKRGDAVLIPGGAVIVIRAYRGVALEEDSWYHIPVRIEFRAELDR